MDPQILNFCDPISPLITSFILHKVKLEVQYTSRIQDVSRKSTCHGNIENTFMSYYLMSHANIDYKFWSFKLTSHKI